MDLLRLALPFAFSTIIYSLQGVQANSCPEHVTEIEGAYTSVHNHMCYLFVNKEVYWKTARNRCWDLGGEMIAIEDEKTMLYIKSKLNSDALKWDRAGVWLGARYTGGRWRWTNGRQMSYKNWAAGEPSKIFGFLSVEDCSQMRKDDDWQWHDYPCGSLKFYYNYICQFQVVEPSTTATTTIPTTTTKQVETTSSDGITGQSPKSELTPDEYKRLGESLYHILKNKDLPNSYNLLHSRLSNSALSKPGDSAGRVASSASNQEQDNGNASILAIIVGLSCGLLLIMFIIFLLLHFHHRRVKQKANNEASVHFSNGSYHNAPESLPPQSNQNTPPVPCGRPPLPPSDDVYLAPKDVTDLYAEVDVAFLSDEVNKPTNDHLHSVNFSPKTCTCTNVQTDGTNSVCSSGPSSELGACGGSDPEAELRSPLMSSMKTNGIAAGSNGVAGPYCCKCSTNQGEYIDMNSMKTGNGKCVHKDEEKHTYSNVDMRESVNENHYEVLP